MRRGAGAVLVALLALTGGPGRAADAPAATSAPAAADGSARPAPSKGVTAGAARPSSRVKEGTLVVFNRSIVTFRANFLGATPTQRADAAKERINGLLARGGPGIVSVEPVPQGSVVKIDGSLAFFVTEGRLFLRHIDGAPSTYQFWGGVRVQFRR